jgi:hypothetical protein
LGKIGRFDDLNRSQGLGYMEETQSAIFWPKRVEKSLNYIGLKREKLKLQNKMQWLLILCSLLPKVIAGSLACKRWKIG